MAQKYGIKWRRKAKITKVIPGQRAESFGWIPGQRHATDEKGEVHIFIDGSMNGTRASLDTEGTVSFHVASNYALPFFQYNGDNAE